MRKGGYRFSERSCSIKTLERDDDAKKGHPALRKGAVARRRLRFFASALLSQCIAVPMPLVLKLAARNLLYDKLRFAATVIGIVFSIVLVTVQLGLFVSFERTVTIMIDHAPA